MPVSIDVGVVGVETVKSPIVSSLPPLSASLIATPTLFPTHPKPHPQRIICSQCLFLAGFLPRLFDHMADVDKKTKKMALKSPLIGIVGAGGQLG